MLQESRRYPENLAWLLEPGRRQALVARSWEAEPARGALSFFAPDFALGAAQPWLVGERLPPPSEPSAAPAPAAPVPTLLHRAEPSSADFARLHEDILRRIAAGEFAKVVPMVCEELEFAVPLRPADFPGALTPHEGQFAYGFSFAGEGMCGVTPEVLFAVEDGILRTMALAGTGAVDGPSLLDDRKERHEHQLVIDHIAGELKARGRVEVGVTGERRFGRLKHLFTPIEVKLNDRADFMDLVVRLHPTAALGGWPRRPAAEWLERQSFHVSRRRFGAPFGWQDGDDLFCAVAIRGLQWQGARAEIGTGCGVVAGSDSLREWRELGLKRAAIYSLLGWDGLYEQY
jgi:menaquinone-specific isochorismate synthase